MHARVMAGGFFRRQASYRIPEVPVKASKGKRLGSCNRTHCQGPGAFWYNRNMDAWYCTDCAHALNQYPLENGEYLCVLDEEALNEHTGPNADYAKRSALALSGRYK